MARILCLGGLLTVRIFYKILEWGYIYYYYYFYLGTGGGGLAPAPPEEHQIRIKHVKIMSNTLQNSPIALKTTRKNKKNKKICNKKFYRCLDSSDQNGQKLSRSFSLCCYYFVKYLFNEVLRIYQILNSLQ